MAKKIKPMAKTKKVPWQELGGKKFLESLKNKSGKEIAEIVKKHCGVRPSATDIFHAFDRYEVTREIIAKLKKEVPAPILTPKKWPEPPVMEITQEAWDKPGKRVGAWSRPDWKSKGARAGIIYAIYERMVEDGNHYFVLNGGLANKKDVTKRVKEELEKHTKAQRRTHFAAIKEFVLKEMALELNSIIPLVKKPSSEAKDGKMEYVRNYIMTSLVIDGDDGERIAQIMQQLRPDIRIYKQGGDFTRLKGVGVTKEEKHRGQELGWLNPKRQRLPGDYASTTVDSDIRIAESAARRFPSIWGHGGLGTSTSKPGGGEKKIPRFGIPVSHIPMPIRPGEPSIVLNQIGTRTIETSLDGQRRLIRTWNLRDLAEEERKFITGIKEGATELHRKIVNEIVENPDGLHEGELSDNLEVSREKIKEAISFLIEPKALKRTTWPGLYKDAESGRYNFHLDWLQERLRYPWPYEKDYFELRRLLMGCLHAGYTTTDYEFVRYRLPEIILERRIEYLEIIGDVIAGLKHNLIHRGEIIGNINYTEQGVFAGELVGNCVYDVFAVKFKSLFDAHKDKKFSPEELEKCVRSALITVIYIMGNHDDWQKDSGHSPAVVFRLSLVTLLIKHIGKFLHDLGYSLYNLDEIIAGNIVELPEYKTVYEFPGGICTELFHPGMARTKTTSIRAEETLGFSDCHLVDIANFHTFFEMEKWEPGLGDRVAGQAGAMVPFTQFERGKLKRVDFGPMYIGLRHKNRKIFMIEHEFFNKPILKRPISKNTDINVLKDKLKLLRIPYLDI